MWLSCMCGSKIHDNHDQNRDKARFYPDEDWYQISVKNDDSDLIPRSDLRRFRLMLQCMDCFRIYIENNEGKFVPFKAEEKISFGFLESN
jgi:hypothetical protein